MISRRAFVYERTIHVRAERKFLPALYVFHYLTIRLTDYLTTPPAWARDRSGNSR